MRRLVVVEVIDFIEHSAPELHEGWAAPDASELIQVMRADA